MKLSTQEIELFYDLMWPLQFFVNQKLQILPEIKTFNAYKNCSTGEKVRVRSALYENSAIIDQFVDENPSRFSDNRLDIIKSWKHFVAGEFYIERLLKKYAVFIADQNVYGVFALYDDFKTILFRGNLPILVKAVLLPFKGKIIYDGFLQSYNIYFGGGISQELKEIYMTAKQNGRIIETFDNCSDKAKQFNPKVPAKDFTLELDVLIKEAKKLRGGAGQPPIHTPAFSLVKASLEFAQSVVTDADDMDSIYKALKKVNRAYSGIHTTLERSEEWC